MSTATGLHQTSSQLLNIVPATCRNYRWPGRGRLQLFVSRHYLINCTNGSHTKSSRCAMKSMRKRHHSVWTYNYRNLNPGVNHNPSIGARNPHKQSRNGLRANWKIPFHFSCFWRARAHSTPANGCLLLVEHWRINHPYSSPSSTLTLTKHKQNKNRLNSATVVKKIPIRNENLS